MGSIGLTNSLATQAGQTGALGHTWLFIKSTVVPGVVESKLKSVMLVFSTDGTFQRVLQMQGIDMSPEDRLRLFALPTVKQ